MTDNLESRLQKAEKYLEKFANYDIDTAAALAILDSNERGIKNMVRDVSVGNKHDVIMRFLLTDNPNLDVDLINSRLFWKYKIFKKSTIDRISTIIAIGICIIPAIIVTTLAHIFVFAKLDDIRDIMLGDSLVFMLVSLLTLYIVCD